MLGKMDHYILYLYQIKFFFDKKCLIDWEAIHYLQCFKETETKKDVYAKISESNDQNKIDIEIRILYYPWTWE